MSAPLAHYGAAVYAYHTLPATTAAEAAQAQARGWSDADVARLVDGVLQLPPDARAAFAERLHAALAS